jgi:hypothetical protein
MAIEVAKRLLNEVKLDIKRKKDIEILKNNMDQNDL